MRPLPVILAALVLLVAGCAAPEGDDHAGEDRGGEGHGDAEGGLPYTGQEDVLVTVVGGSPEEFRFTPDAIQVAAGQTVGITFTNDGSIPHEFSINAYDFHLHLEPGEAAQAAFVAEESGTFTFGCYIPGHFEAGMKGTLRVSP